MPRVYSIYDKKMQEFGQLAVAKNDETFRRAVVENVKGSGSLIEKYPVDYQVFRVAEFDSSSGFISGYTPVVLVCEVAELLQAEPARMVRDAN